MPTYHGNGNSTRSQTGDEMEDIKNNNISESSSCVMKPVVSSARPEVKPVPPPVGEQVIKRKRNQVSTNAATIRNGGINRMSRKLIGCVIFYNFPSLN